jgi:hypothetical protein
MSRVRSSAGSAMRWPKMPKNMFPTPRRRHVRPVKQPEMFFSSPTEFTYPENATEEEVNELYFAFCDDIARYERRPETTNTNSAGDPCQHTLECIDLHASEVTCKQCALVLRKFYSEAWDGQICGSVYIRRHRWKVRIDQLQCCDAPPHAWLNEKVLEQFNLMCTKSNRVVASSKTRIMACLRILKKQEPDAARRRIIGKSAEKWIHFKHSIDKTKPIKMCPELQRFLSDVFPGIERAFEQFKTILGRTSLIHYNFCLTRAIQEFIARNDHNLDKETLAQCESFLPLLPMLKSRPKVKNNDILWDHMRKWLNWHTQELPQAKIYRGFK